MDNVEPLKKEELDFIDNLVARELLGGECKRLYLMCKEAQAGMRTTVKTDKITDAQCTKNIAEIRSLLENKTRTGYLKAAEMLRQLLHGHWHEITMLAKANSHIGGDITEIKDTLCAELFTPVLDKFDKHEETVHSKEYNEKYNKEMEHYRPTFVELNQYVFVVSDKQDKFFWMRAACAAWYCALERLAKAESFREDDVDCLLDLKRIVPDVPNPRIRILLGEALEHFLSVMLNEGTSNIPYEKLATISQWIEDLARIKGASKQQQERNDAKLKELNEAWKRKNKDTTVSVTFDQPVSDATLIQPESDAYKIPLLSR